MDRRELYDIPLRRIDGSETTLAEYRGRVLLIVNVASRCGFTPQYAGLQELHEKYSARGFAVLGFPCNQFGAQEPGTESEIDAFCKENYQVTFPLFAKVDVNGENTHALFAYLKQAAPGLLRTEAIKWNFTKFLVDKTGTQIERFASATAPAEIESSIVARLSC